MHLQLKWDYLEKLPKYLWINFPISNVIPAAEFCGKHMYASPTLGDPLFHLRTSYCNFCSIPKHHPGQCEHGGKDHGSSPKRASFNSRCSEGYEGAVQDVAFAGARGTDRHGAAHCGAGPWEGGQALKTLSISILRTLQQVSVKKVGATGWPCPRLRRGINVSLLKWFRLQRRVKQPGVAKKQGFGTLKRLLLVFPRDVRLPSTYF